MSYVVYLRIGRDPTHYLHLQSLERLDKRRGVQAHVEFSLMDDLHLFLAPSYDEIILICK